MVRYFQCVCEPPYRGIDSPVIVGQINYIFMPSTRPIVFPVLAGKYNDRSISRGRDQQSNENKQSLVRSLTAMPAWDSVGGAERVLRRIVCVCALI